MIFVDKSVLLDQGNAEIAIFLQDAWEPVQGAYIGIDYKHGGFPLEAIKSLLRQEQNGLCCYCMRNLNAERGTIEHIVPYATSDPTELTRYFDVALIETQVVLKDQFAAPPLPKTPPPFPHDVAYANLMLSCDGVIVKGQGKGTAQCCNHHRKNDFIIPIPLIPEAIAKVNYNKSGLIAYDVELKQTVEDSLNLNYQLLEQIRRLWYLVARVGSPERLEEADADAGARLELIADAVEIDGPKGPHDDKLWDTFTNDLFWNTFRLYTWFFYHFRAKENVGMDG